MFSYVPEQQLIENFNLAGTAGTAYCDRRAHRMRQDDDHQPADAFL